MDFAFIVPEKHLELAAVSKTQMVLTPYYLLSKAYREFYQERSRQGDFILLDNGFHEYDRQQSDGWDIIDAIVDQLHPTVAVMPETPIWDPDLILDNLEHIYDYPASRNGDSEYRTGWLYVVRSMNMVEAQEEIHFLRDNDPEHRVEWVGIHKDIEMLAKGNTGGRRVFYEMLQPELEPFNVWMLGTFKSPAEEIKTFKDLPKVRGCDSSKPWRVCSQGRRVEEVRPFPDPFDFKQEIDDPTLEFCRTEFKRFRKFVTNGRN